MIKVIDNAVPLLALKTFYDKITSSRFPWYWSPVVSDGANEVDTKKQFFNFQFAHNLYDKNVPRNEWFNQVSGLLDFIPDLHSLVRYKINCNPCYSSVVEHSFHTDVSFECTTAIIYLNTNNGYTLFESGEKVESVAGRMVIFPSSTLHTGTTCSDTQGRFVANVNYF